MIDLYGSGRTSTGNVGAVFTALVSLFTYKLWRYNQSQKTNSATLQTTTTEPEKPSAKALNEYRKTFAKYAEKNHITKSEWDELRALQQQLKLSAESIAPEINEYLRLCQNTETKDTLPKIEAPGIAIHREETVHHYERASELAERVTKREYKGGSHGISVRVAKGVSVRMGSQKGKIHTTTSVIPISDGDFYITSQRLIYRSHKKSFNYRYDQIESLEITDNTIIIGAPNGNMRTIKLESNAPEHLAHLINSAIKNQNKN